MKSYRVLIVEFINLSDLQNFYIQEFKFRKELIQNNIRINYRKSNRNNIELIGYNEKSLHSYSNFVNLDKILMHLDKIYIMSNNNIYNKLCGLRYKRKRVCSH